VVKVVLHCFSTEVKRNRISRFLAKILVHSASRDDASLGNVLRPSSSRLVYIYIQAEARGAFLYFSTTEPQLLSKYQRGSRRKKVAKEAQELKKRARVAVVCFSLSDRLVRGQSVREEHGIYCVRKCEQGCLICAAISERERLRSRFPPDLSLICVCARRTL
jgi:hypothetical protein